VINSRFETANSCLSLAGLAVNNGESKITGVKVVLDKLQVFEIPVNNTLWKFKTCELTEGSHEVEIFSENELSHKSNSEQLFFYSSFNSATGTLQTHMESGRLRWADYGHWYALFGNKLFILYQWKDLIWRDKKED
jgi:hypothetical protein